MRTTIRIRDELLERAKKRAVEEGRTFTSLVEEGLLLVLTAPRDSAHKPVRLPVSKVGGGVLPGVDLNRSSSLEDLMDQL